MSLLSLALSVSQPHVADNWAAVPVRAWVLSGRTQQLPPQWSLPIGAGAKAPAPLKVTSSFFPL